VDNNGKCDASACKECVDCSCGSKCDPANCETCINGECKVCGGDPDQVCCNGSCCDTSNCECVDGECLCCWTLEISDSFQYGSCYCEGGTCEGEVQTGYHHSCKLASSGSRECVYRLNQPIGWTWDCEASTNWCGVLACYLLNAGVCGLQCTAAVEACGVCPGSWECSQALIDCYECLTGEGIDCGCLVITCVPSQISSGKYYGGDNILQGGSCP